MTQRALETTLHVTWSLYMMYARILADKMRPFEPKALLGLPRGGWILAGILSHLLPGTQLLSVGQPYAWPQIWGNNSHLWVVDDIADTGVTIKKGVALKHTPIAVMHYRATCDLSWYDTVVSAQIVEPGAHVMYPYESAESTI